MYPNGLTDLTEIWNQDFLGDDASFELISPSWEIGPGTFKGDQTICLGLINCHFPVYPFVQGIASKWDLYVIGNEQIW